MTRGLSQAQLAEKTGMQPSAIAHFEGGRRKPSFDNVRVLAGALNVTADHLLGSGGGTTAFRDEEKLTTTDRAYVQGIIDMMIQQKHGGS
jgi:transcriptional regulator with XRE-family HTH domain